MEKIVRRASSRGRSSHTIGHLCIVQLTQLPAAEKSILTPLPFVWRRAVPQRSSRHKSVFVPASAVDMGCCAIVDVKVCSLSVDTSLYPVTLPRSDPHGATLSLAISLQCGVTVTVTGLRAHVTLFGEIEALIHELTVTQAESTVSHSTRCCTGSRPTCQYAAVS